MTTTTQPLRGYQRHIALATGVTDPAVLAEIEDAMRAVSPTLDHLTARQLAALARQSQGYLEAIAQAAVVRHVGDLVGCSRRPGSAYRIIKVNGETYRLQDVATGQQVRASKSLVTDPPAGAEQIEAAAPAVPVITKRRVGDLAGCSRRPGRTYRIKRVNDRSYTMTDLATGRELRADKTLVTDPPSAGV